MEERWSSLGELTAAVASHAAAPARAHLRAIKNRQRGITEENSQDSDKHGRRDSKRVSLITDKELFHVSFLFLQRVLCLIIFMVLITFFWNIFCYTLLKLANETLAGLLKGCFCSAP